MRAKIWLAHQLVAQRAVLVLTVLLGLAYPLTMTAVAQIPGLRNQRWVRSLIGSTACQPAAR
jgi:K+-transporting ATPase ATPase C chain